MSVAAKYINRELLAIFVTALLMLLLVAVGGRFIGYLQEAAMGKFTGTTVLTIMALRLPEFVQQVAPFAIYVAIVLTMGRLYAEQEMVVLQGAGASTQRLLSWISISLGFVVAMVAALSIVFTPMSLRVLDQYLFEQQIQTEFETVNPGTFHIYDRGDRVTYSEAMSDDRQVLQNIFMSERLEDGRQVVIWADTGHQRVDAESGDHFLVLSDGRRYEGVATAADMRVMTFSQLSQRLEINEVRRGRVEVEALATAELGEHSKGRAEWHWRLAMPLFCLIGGLLALGVSRVKPRQGRFARVVPGVLLMLIYYLALLVNRNALGEGELPDMAGMWIVHGAFAAIAGWLLWRLGRPVSA